MRRISLVILSASLVLPAVAQLPPTPLQGLDYDFELVPGTTYDDQIPTIEELLGFEIGDRAALPEEIERCVLEWAEASPRVSAKVYARSHEDRALYAVTVSSPANIERLDDIKKGLARLADPRGLAEAEAQRLLDELPATAWLAYSIHGDETSGSDGALAVLYHLTAATSEVVEKMLDEVVVVIDPMENPDGRHRFLQQLTEHRGAQPSVDDQSLLHAGYWPWGRTNHYGFDLNRDWILGTQPESRGRITEAASWHPLLMVDAHEMGSQDTYLFSPARQPSNPHVPKGRAQWSDRFAAEQAAAFDRHGWSYYQGEWNEGWYPGYTDTWGTFRGAVGILYEQAGWAEDAVRYPGGKLFSYGEAVHHQAASSIANLESLQRHAGELRRAFLAEKRAAVSSKGRYGDRIWAVLPTANRARLQRFVDLMKLQGFEMSMASAGMKASGIDQLGRSFRDRPIPQGTLLIPNSQPQAHLLATMLEFDTRLTGEYLSRERKEILRSGRSTIYDSTAWNLTMMHGLQALELSGGLPAAAQPWEGQHVAAAEEPKGPALAWIVDGEDDDSLAMAARLLERGVETRVATKAFTLEGREFERGSVVVLAVDNRRFVGDLEATLGENAREVGMPIHALSTGLGEGDLPDLGGGNFERLEAPRIAIVGRDGGSVYDIGSIWHALDLRVGIRHSQLNGDTLGRADLRRYNVIVLPDRWFGELEDGTIETLVSWAEQGGTLIAIGASAAALTRGDEAPSAARALRDSLEELDAYELALIREWLAISESLPATDAVWSHTAAEGPTVPWSSEAPKRADKTELERADTWQRMFMPQGAFLAARVDQESWLTFGTPAELPVLYGRSGVLMAKPPVEAPVRFGVYEQSSKSTEGRVGWSLLPENTALRLRASGLLWPEAASRLAHGAVVTREAKGRGQIILFPQPPSFRASTIGTERLLLNALIYGPGLGASTPIMP